MCRPPPGDLLDEDILIDGYRICSPRLCLGPPPGHPSHCRQLRRAPGTMVVKEFLDSDRVNFLIWRFVPDAPNRASALSTRMLDGDDGCSDELHHLFFWPSCSSCLVAGSVTLLLSSPSSDVKTPSPRRLPQWFAGPFFANPLRRYLLEGSTWHRLLFCICIFATAKTCAQPQRLFTGSRL